MERFEASQFREEKLENKSEQITSRVRDIIFQSGRVPCSISFFEGAFRKAADEFFLETEAWPYWQKDLQSELQKEGLVERKKGKSKGRSTIFSQKAKKQMVAQSEGRDWPGRTGWDGN